jgi:hypothetical protein
MKFDIWVYFEKPYRKFKVYWLWTRITDTSHTLANNTVGQAAHTANNTVG